MIEGNQLCICGHEKDFHSEIPGNFEVINCKKCLMIWQSRWSVEKIICKEFRLDNLRYLEDLYNEKSSTHIK